MVNDSMITQSYQKWNAHSVNSVSQTQLLFRLSVSLLGSGHGAAGVYQGGVGSNDKEAHRWLRQLWCLRVHTASPSFKMVAQQSFEKYFSIFLRFEWVSINPPGQIFHFERIIHTGEGELCYSLHVPLIFAPRWRPNDWQDPAWRVEENLPDAVESILRMSGWVAKCFGAKVERFVGKESHRKSRDLNLDSLNLGSTERFGKSELVWPHWVRWDRVAKRNIDKGPFCKTWSSRHFL